MKSKYAMGKGYFPCQEGLRKAAILALLLSLPALAQAEARTQSAWDQANILAIAHTRAAINDQAKANHWKGEHSSLKVFIPPALSHAAPCPQTPAIRQAATGMHTPGRYSWSLQCPSLPDWQYNVTVMANIYLPVVVPREHIPRNTLLTADMFTLKPFNISYEREQPLTDAAQLVGLTNCRDLPPLRPVLLTMTQQPMLVKRDQPVMMASETGALVIQASGTALKNGRRGDMIRVRNDSSQRVVDVVVVGPGEVALPQAAGK